VAEQGLLRNGDYVRYRIARGTSLLGSQLSGVCYMLLVLALGGGAVQAGAIGSASLITRSVCRLPGGHVADRFDRRRLMYLMDLICVVAVGSIPLASAAGLLRYPQLLAVAIIEGAASSVFRPSATVFIRDVVPPGLLQRALSQMQTSTAAISTVGPLAGGALFGFGRMLPFTADAASYGVSCALLLWGSVVRRPETPAVQAVARPARTDNRMTAGLRWLWGQQTVMRLVYFASALNFTAAAAPVAVVVVLREHGTAPVVIGALMGCIGAGSVLGAMASARLIGWLGTARLFLLVGFAWAAGFAAFAVDASAYVVGPVLVLLFVVSPASGRALYNVTVGEAPHELLGRVSTAENMISSSLATVAPLLAGTLLAVFGDRSIWLVLAGICVVVTVVAVLPMAVTRKPRGPVVAEPQAQVPAGERG